VIKITLQSEEKYTILCIRDQKIIKAVTKQDGYQKRGDYWLEFFRTHWNKGVNRKTTLKVVRNHRYLLRIDNLVTAFSCNSVGTAGIDCQIHLVADVGIFEM
jgi:hypothetical protein